MIGQASGDAAALVRKLWHYCIVLHDDGLSYPDYVDQITYLLFLKMSDEQGVSLCHTHMGGARSRAWIRRQCIGNTAGSLPP